eukprot:SAG31_NODE_23961_length_492_cov_0.949109_1_plen_67_part_01
MPAAASAAEALEREGFCVVKDVYPAELVEDVKRAIDGAALQTKEALDAFQKNPFQGIFSLTAVGAPC